MKRTAMFFLAAYVGVLASPAFAESAADAPQIELAKVDLKKSIDLRENKSEDAWRMLVFMARDSNPEKDSNTGHAYVAALKWRADIQGFVTISVFGAYPYAGDNSRGKLDYIDGDGSIGLEPLDQFPEAALLVSVDSDQLARAIAVRDKWQREGEWSILFKDCVTMFQDVARTVGLNLPNRKYNKPYDYLVKVIDKN